MFYYITYAGWYCIVSCILLAGGIILYEIKTNQYGHLMLLTSILLSAIGMATLEDDTIFTTRSDRLAMDIEAEKEKLNNLKAHQKTEIYDASLNLNLIKPKPKQPY